MAVLEVQDLNKEEQYIIIGIEDGWLKADINTLKKYYKIKNKRQLNSDISRKFRMAKKRKEFFKH